MTILITITVLITIKIRFQSAATFYCHKTIAIECSPEIAGPVVAQQPLK